MGLAIYEKEPNITWVNYKFIEQRIDAQYYKREFVENEIKLKQIKNLPLKELYTRGDYGTLPDSADYSEKGIYLIRGTDLRDLSIKEDDLILVPEEYFSDKSEVKSEDILILIKGATIDAEWSVSIVPKINYKAIFNGSIFRIRLKKEYDPYFVTAFMSTKYFLYQKKRAISNTGIYYNDKESIENFIISIPSPEIQKYIGDKVRKAEELREEAKRLKKEAEEILNKELNLKDVEFYIKQTNNKKYSWTESIEIEDRIDSEFYKPKYRYLSKLNNMSELSYYYKISKKRINKNIDRKIKYIDLSSVNNIIEPSDFNTKELPSRAQFLVKEGNLIISTLKGSNKISIIPEHLNDSVCSTGFIVIASKSHLTTEYLYLVFSNKVFNMQIERYSTGSIMSGVNHDNFNKMLIPVISNKQIIDTITNKIRKHFRLLYYSKQLIQEAKQDVEDLIEGNFDMSKVKANN